MAHEGSHGKLSSPPTRPTQTVEHVTQLNSTGQVPEWICVNKNSTRCTVQHKLTSKDMMSYLQLSFYDCLNIFSSKFPTADTEQ